MAKPCDSNVKNYPCSTKKDGYPGRCPSHQGSSFQACRARPRRSPAPPRCKAPTLEWVAPETNRLQAHINLAYHDGTSAAHLSGNGMGRAPLPPAALRRHPRRTHALTEKKPARRPGKRHGTPGHPGRGAPPPVRPTIYHGHWRKARPSVRAIRLSARGAYREETATKRPSCMLKSMSAQQRSRCGRP